MFTTTLLAALALTVGQPPEKIEPAMILRGHPAISNAVFSPDGKRLAVVAQDIEVYDVAILQRFGQDGMELFAARNRLFAE